MPYSIYEKLGDAKLVHTDLIIQLADGSSIYPEGILENEIVKVNKFVYPADFFIIKMTDPAAKESTGVLLGRPFLSTAGTVIDVGKGTMHLDFNGERLTFGIDEEVRKPQNGESMRSAETAKPRVQECLEKEPFQGTSTDSAADEQFKKEAAEWFNAKITEGMNDEAIEKAIMDFCKSPQSVRPNGTTQPAGGEKPLDQGTPVGRMLKENPAPAGQSLSLPALPVTLQNPSTKMYQAPDNPDLRGQKGQLLDELRLNQEAIEGKISDFIGIDPGPCLHSTLLKKGKTPHFDQQCSLKPAIRNRELAVGQKDLLFQNQLELISERRKVKWADPCTNITIRSKEAIGPQGSNPDSPSLMVKEQRVRPYCDKTKVGMMEEIPLIMPNSRQ